MKKSVGKKISLAAVAAMLFVAPSYAEETKKSEEGGHGNVYILDTIVTEATRAIVDNMKYAGSVGVLHEEELKNETNVIDAIMDIPGVDGGMDGGREIGRQFQIRGYGYQTEDYVIIQQDGVPRSASLYSNMISSFRTDTDILKRVEVTKGASSILYGSGAIGGIVSMQTKDAKDWLMPGEQLGGMAGFRLETNHMHSIRGAVYGAFDKVPIDFVVYGKKADFGDMKFADGGSHYADPPVTHNMNDETIRTALVKLGLDLEEHKFKFSLFDYNEKLNTQWQTLWHIATEEDDTYVHGRLKQTDMVFDYNFNPKTPWVDLGFKTYYTKAKYDRGYEDVGAARSTAEYINSEKRWGFDLKNTSRFDTWALNHNFLLGVNYQNRKEDANWFDHGQPLDRFESHPNEWRDFGIYAQDIIKFKDLEVTIGGRYDDFKREITKTGAESEMSNDHFSPRIAIAYTLPFNFTLLAGYAESFRAPTPHEGYQEGYVNNYGYYLRSEDLKPEVAKEYEVGFSFKQDNLLSDNDGLRFKAIYFNGRIDDLIDLKELPELGTPPPDPVTGLTPSQYVQYQNVGLAKRHGLEIDGEYRIGDFRFGASYETLKLYDTETYEDITKHASKLMGRINYSPIDNLDLGIKISHWFDPKSKPATTVSGGETVYYVDRDFTIVDFTGRYKLTKNTINIAPINGVDIVFGVKNIFDKQYINAGRLRTANHVGQARNWFVSMEVTF